VRKPVTYRRSTKNKQKLRQTGAHQSGHLRSSKKAAGKPASRGAIEWVHERPPLAGQMAWVFADPDASVVVSVAAAVKARVSHKLETVACTALLDRRGDVRTGHARHPVAGNLPKQSGTRRSGLNTGICPIQENPMISKNTICLWYDGAALEAAKFYAETFPDSAVGAVNHAPGDYPAGKQGNVLTVEFTVMGIPCLGLNGGPVFKHNEAFSFQVATDDQAETDRLWNAIVGNGGQESACGWCKDKWGLSWQITPRALTDAITDPDRVAAKRAFDAMMEMRKIDIATIEAARRG
jgi:predicted 3-demethylubiquinone-9 3-methyltransferase (glyoxalase superfamily)